MGPDVLFATLVVQVVHVVPVVVGLAVLLELEWWRGGDAGTPCTCSPGPAICYLFLSYFSCIM